MQGSEVEDIESLCQLSEGHSQARWAQTLQYGLLEVDFSGNVLEPDGPTNAVSAPYRSEVWEKVGHFQRMDKCLLPDILNF